MEKLLARLERRFGRYAISGFTYYLVAAQGVVLLLEQMRPGFSNLLAMDGERVLQGEVWRLVSYICIPPSTHMIWGAFGIYWLYFTGTSLEAQWGHFKYQAYWLTGMLLTTVFAFLLGVPATGWYLILAVFLGFATLWPDFQLLLIILPVKAKWLAILDGLFLASQVGTLPGLMKLMPVLAVGNYLLFFSAHLAEALRGYFFRAKRVGEFNKFRREATEARPATRRCVKCGVNDVDNPRAEFRICVCEKCAGKPTEFCMDHIRDH